LTDLILSKRLIKLHFQNGLDLESFKREVFDIDNLTDIYDFEESDAPDFVLFGPYGNDIPARGNYTRIGYFCENIEPDMSICEWAFGVPREDEVGHPNYKRIQWHGQDPRQLIKPPDYDPEKILASKTKFCNFLYSNKVAYREAFFSQLSAYKQVDAPGRSMNNMPPIDNLYSGNKWDVKRRFLSNYKFTIAFENDIYPGYQTEKLYDAMLSDSIPVYCGDPNIGEVFNTKAVINFTDYVDNGNTIIKWLEKISHKDFIDIRPQYYHDPVHRVKRKLKSIGRNLKTYLQAGNVNFRPLIDRIIELDRDNSKYLEMLSQPWFNNNAIPANTSSRNRWIEIFNSR
jgi:hypothetical protein